MIFGFGMCAATLLPLNNTGMPALEIGYLVPGTIAVLVGLSLVKLAAAPPKALHLRLRPSAILRWLPDPVARRVEKAPRPVVLATVASIVGGPIFAVVTARAGGLIVTRIRNAGLDGDPGLVSLLWELLGGGLVLVWVTAGGYWQGPRSARINELAALLVVTAAGALLLLYK